MVVAKMTKQEEIRGGVAERIYKWYYRNSQLNDLGKWKDVSGFVRGMVLAITDIVLEYEDSQGAVIKVETWLPTRSDMTCTIEPLIKGVKK